MAKATVTTPDGMTVKIDGSPDEIAALLRRIKAQAPLPTARAPKKRAGARPSLIDLIESLVDGAYFKTPRGLADVKAALAEMGHHYPITTLSGAMLRQVRRGSLRRLKKDKRWVYIKRDK